MAYILDEQVTKRNVVAPRDDRVIYLSGPMSGHPEFNFPFFNHVEDRLRCFGHVVINPVTFSHAPDADFAEIIQDDLNAMRDARCNAIALIEGWATSRGASHYEIPFAQHYGYEFFYFDNHADLLVPMGGSRWPKDEPVRF